MMSLPFEYTYFQNVQARTREARRGTWEDIVHAVSNPREYDAKEHMPLIKLATFGDTRTDAGSLRHDGNVRGVYGVEGDYDRGIVSVDEAVRALRDASIEAVVYTTPRHSPEQPRWRVLAPTSQPCSAKSRRELAGVLNAALNGILAVESFSLSQSFYFGKVRGREYRAERVRGDCIDKNLFLEAVYPASLSAITAASGSRVGSDQRKFMLCDVTDTTIADIESALAALDANKRCGPHSYHEWLEIIFALKSLDEAGRGERAWQLAVEFSQRGGDAFNLKVLEAKWRENPHSTTYKTIFMRAAEDGWRNPRASVHDDSMPDGGRTDRTDSGNVNLLFEKTSGNLRYITELRCWMHFAGGAWFVDPTGGAALRAAQVVGEHYFTLAAAKNEEAEQAQVQARTADCKHLTKVAESIRAWGARCRNRHGIDSMLALAARDARFAISVTALDRDPWMLGVANGVVNLRTGELRRDSRDAFTTKRSPFRFDPHHPAPRFRRFVQEITGLPDGRRGIVPRPAVEAYLQRAVGYWATGSIAEHKMFVNIGAGANGKSVLFDVLAEVFGPYCVLMPAKLMMVSGREGSGEGPTPFEARLAGARLAYGSEPKEGSKLDAAWVKRHTGEGKQTARGLQQDPFTFATTHKLALLTNHEPPLDHLDDATRARFHMLPYEVQWNRPGVPQRNESLPDADKGLTEKLLAEGDGVLAWIVEGASLYARDGLNPPQEVATRTLEYFKQQDALELWLEEMSRCSAAEGTGATALFEAFRAWCHVEGFASAGPTTPHAFGRELKRRNVESTRSGGKGTMYGLRALSTEFG
jgi:putative DNA primase/helicase